MVRGPMQRFDAEARAGPHFEKKTYNERRNRGEVATRIWWTWMHMSPIQTVKSDKIQKNKKTYGINHAYRECMNACACQV